MKILVVSDVVTNWIYSPRIRLLLSDTDLVIGCGDLPIYYLEYIVSSLNVPLFHVYGNHSNPEPNPSHSDRNASGLTDLHERMLRFKNYTFAGIEGSLRYKEGTYQYSQARMWIYVFKLVPSLLMNRLRYGKYLNVFVTHAPPWGIHDQSDLAHQGIKAFRWLIMRFQPDYHLHGHIHIYRPDTITKTEIGNTKVINSYGYRKIDL